MFFLIAGVGHCGTQWLASFLNRPDEGMVCRHEQKFRVTPWLKAMPYAWFPAIQYEIEHGVDERYDAYIEYIKEAQQNVAVVGDSHAWEPFIIPKLQERLSIDRIIFMVRNGVQNVHSLYYHNSQFGRQSWFYETYLRLHADLLDIPWGDLDDWGKWCVWWATNVRTPEVLAQTGPVETVKFETLLADADALIRLTKSLQSLARPTTREAQQHAGVDLNRKIEGDRSPDYLWRTWTDHQRQTFKQLCGAAMEHFSYDMPAEPL
jgi:hypothetical protein